MGSYHNLFGNPNEAHVVIDNDGRYHITKIVPGSTIADMLQFARYERAQLVQLYRKQVQSRVDAGTLSQEEADQLAAEYDATADRSTYLE